MKAIFFDLDGTLLNQQHQLHQETVAVIKSLKQKGLTICLASGRTYSSMKPFYRQLELDSPMACYNGAKIVFNEHEVEERGLAPETVRSLIQLSRAEKVHLNLYHNESWFTEAPHSLEAQQYAKKTQMIPVGGSLDQLFKQTCTKALFIASPERLEQLFPIIQMQLGEVVDLTSAMPHFLEVLQKGVNKAYAIQKIADRLGFSLKECLAFGDGLNDLEMLQAVGHGVAMENAREKLKLVAQAVATHHDQQGVAQYLKHYFSLE